MYTFIFSLSRSLSVALVPQSKEPCQQRVSITGSKYLPVVNIYIFWKFVSGAHSWVTGRPTDSEILGLVMIQSCDLSILLSGTVYNEAWEIPVLHSCDVEKARGEHAGNVSLLRPHWDARDKAEITAVCDLLTWIYSHGSEAQRQLICSKYQWMMLKPECKST